MENSGLLFIPNQSFASALRADEQFEDFSYSVIANPNEDKFELTETESHSGDSHGRHVN